jgi:CheY-like chemotaxis protein
MGRPYPPRESEEVTMPTVLVVENDEPAVRLMAWGLMEAGYEVAVAHVPEAATHLTSRQPDIIVFNTLKRDDEKAQLVAAFRELSPGSKVIDVAVPHGEAGPAFADVHLTVPLRVDELVAAIKQLYA